MKKNILFIINPISGGKDKSNFPALVKTYLNSTLFTPAFEFTEYPGHAFKIASQAISSGFDIVVSVGGDGTINEIASALEGTEALMGIIPCGSGNGLARSLNISLSNIKAIAQLNKLNVEVIDTAVLDQWKFFNIGGIGFDAHISEKFSRIASRGFKGYIQTALNEIVNYKPQLYEIEIDGMKLETLAFMISIANSSQYGNNAHISPAASLKDGLLDVCIVKPFPLYHFPVMGYRLFSKTSHKSKYIEIIKGKNIRIKSNIPKAVHLDGEPREISKDIVIAIKPLSLKVLH